jgi:hypothetical protein
VVCAVLAGATSFIAIADWLYDLDEAAQIRLGFTRGPSAVADCRAIRRIGHPRLPDVRAGLEPPADLGRIAPTQCNRLAHA